MVSFLETDVELLKLESEILGDRIERLESEARVARVLCSVSVGLAVFAVVTAAQRNGSSAGRRQGTRNRIVPTAR